jgi:phage terminase Nu1 subunit (DNA packaging protein)
MVDVAIEQLAGLCGLSSTAVTTLARRGIMIRATGAGARGKFVLETSVRGYCTHLREHLAAKRATRRPLTGPCWSRRSAALETKEAVRRGALLDAGAVEAEWIGVARTIRAGVLRAAPPLACLT